MKQKEVIFPELETLEAMLQKEKEHARFWSLIRKTIYSLIVVAAVAVLIATIILPVIRIYGTSMEPTLDEDDVVVLLKGSSYDRGDVAAMYFGNKLLVKRIIAGPGEWVDIDENGNIYIDGELIDEPYLQEKALGECTIDLPYQVPDNQYFVMGDHRFVSQDSRSKEIGCIDVEEIVGRIILRVWPPKHFGSVDNK